MQDQDTYARSRSPGADATEADPPTRERAGEAGSTVTAAAQTATGTARDEARTVARTAKEEAGAVVDEARGQVRRLASEARDQATTRVRGQHDRLVERLRALAEDLGDMAGKGDTPSRAVAQDLADRGRRVADYLADRGPEGLLKEVQDFARRRPGAFLAGAVAAGFLVGRLGKGVWGARSGDSGTGRTGGSQLRGEAAVVASDPVVAPVEVTPPLGTQPAAVEQMAGDPYVGTVPAAPTAPPEAVDPRTVGAPQWTQPPTEAGTPSPYASETYPGEEPAPYHGQQHGGGDRP